MKDLKLGILDRADDDIIDRLVPFSSDDKKTKKRILAMSEKKLAELQRGSETTENEISVRGVEQYHRPMWYKPLSIAAALVFIAGGVGMFTLLNGTKVNQFNDHDQNNVAATTEAVTTEVQTTEATTDAEALPTEEEKKANDGKVLSSVLKKAQPYIDLINLLDKVEDHINKNGLPSSFESVGKEFAESLNRYNAILKDSCIGIMKDAYK